MAIIAVSGAAGYVGKALVLRLMSLGHSVRTNVRTGATVPNTHTTVGDLRREEVAAEWLNTADIVIHCAGYTGEGSPARAQNDNVLTAQAIAHSLHQEQRLIFLSSVAVYGKQAHYGTSELAPVNPGSSVYARSKARAESIFSHGTANFIALRPGLVWGGEDARLVRPLSYLLKRRLCILPGECATPLPFTHIDNLLDAIELATTSRHCGVFNITDSENASFREFCQRLAMKLEAPPPNSWLSTRSVRWSIRALNRMPSALTGRLRPDLLMLLNTECSFDLTRARKVLGYTPAPREHMRIGLRD